MTDTPWYYADASQQRQGPLPARELRRLHQEGQIDGHANRIIAEARMRHPDNEQALHAELTRRGGTRWWAVVLGLLTYILVLGALSYLFDP